MTTQDENPDTAQSQYFDPFPQPQTIPSGWDLSGLISDPQPVTVTKAADSDESNTQVHVNR